MINYKIKMFNGCHEDNAMHYCLAAIVDKVFLVKEELYHYNNGNNNSLMHSGRHMNDYSGAVQYAIRFLQERNLFQKTREDLERSVAQTVDNFQRNFSDSRYTDTNEELNKLLYDYFPKIYEEKFLKRKEKIMQEGTQGIVLFGAGADGQSVIEQIGKDKIKYIVDNNRERVGQSLYGISIVGFETLLEDKENPLILISSTLYYYDIAHQLRTCGIINYINVFDYIKKLLVN